MGGAEVIKLRPGINIIIRKKRLGSIFSDIIRGSIFFNGCQYSIVKRVTFYKIMTRDLTLYRYTGLIGKMLALSIEIL